MPLKSIFSIVFCFYALVTHCQSSKTNKAHKLFASKAYIQASELYEELTETNDSITLNLADCYYYNGMMDKAAENYLKVFQNPYKEISNSYYFKYAHALYGIDNIEVADSIMSIYTSHKTDTPLYIENLEHAIPFLYDVQLIKSGNIPGDFAINYYDEKVSFSSLRKNASRKYKWNEESYLDIYIANFTEEGNLENIEELPANINTNTHESNAVLSSDGNTLYFSRTNNKRTEIDDIKIATVKLYKATKVDGEWNNIEELPFSSNLYSVMHPALNTNNDKLYFSSDMKGGQGSFDIYYVDISSDSTYSEPINLGSKINTRHREQFPFISKDTTLYYASDGLQGLGGLDVFMCEFNKNDENWNTPLNLGNTINTGKDDFSFVVNSEENTGFLSSNRSGRDNLYSFLRRDKNRSVVLEGTVKDLHSQEILPNTSITIFDENNNAIDSVKVDKDGRYKFHIKPFKTYKIEGFKPLYIPKAVDFDTDDSGKIELNIELELESYDDAEEIVYEKDGYVYIQLENIYFELDKWNIEPQAASTLNVLIELMKKYPRMEVELGAHTDTRSSNDYNLKLSNNRANSAMQYIISKGINQSRMKAVGYGETQLLVDCGNECSEEEHSINRRCEFIITK
ncbi:OmpA family protein [Psychroserpens ponticola]|uniref:OmpA family protein n=1 Tax=Psychroserpens ponticola TaxID=2932268 RepID=A0ABY7RUI4_9FLAO|nr:OmpA family protein [Psychroserpens ponticola]WCO00788.1 OmpA family protein [Psychroserpens ponticola]